MTLQLPTYVKQKVNNAILPVEYMAAVNAIQKCMTIDESKYWSDKADALAAWAKIYENDQASIEAKRLKLHAFRRMAEIAESLRPGGYSTRRGCHPGPKSLLMEHGLRAGQAANIVRIGAIQKNDFESMVNAPSPPGIIRAAFKGVGRRNFGGETSSDSWRILTSSAFPTANNCRKFLTFCRNHSARDLARGLNPGEVRAARELVRELTEWLDELEQYLPKA